MKKIAIIGGGASGLMSAIITARHGHHVHLFEANDKVGKKILASGNGRCNISNHNLHVNDYFGEDPAFVAFALKEFDFKTFEKFFFSLGLLLEVKDDGKIYPHSNEAKAVTSVLEHYALKCGVAILNNIFIKRVEKIKDRFNLFNESDKKYKEYDAVVIATGSQAAPQLGANDSGYDIAASFQHTIIPAYPSLVQLHLDSAFHHKMSGVKQNATVALYIDNKKEAEVNGDILFTKYGISGFAILDISQKASLALLQYHHVSIGLAFFETMQRQQLANTLTAICNNLASYSVLEILSTLVPSKMAPFIMQSSKIDVQTLSSSLTPKQIKSIVNTLKNWRFEVTQTHGFQHAEVSGGGVSTADINPKTMESNKVKGLYFTGEVLDIVGRRGGYNLHFAWASGYTAALSINSNIGIGGD
jgi:hypothetical protein